MSLSWPWALWALALIPALLTLRWWATRRRKRAAVRVTSVALVRTALPRARRWRRVVPSALLVLGLVTLSVAAARPQKEVSIASNETTILLTLDVSGSMCSTDVDPSRLEAAEKAAAKFIEAQPGGSQIGLVTFASFATVVVPPTDDADKLLKAVGSLTTSHGTAIGQGILTSLDAIAEVDPTVAGTGTDVTTKAAKDYAADAVVLLTDGSNSAGIDPTTAAQEAADRGVRVYTIGFGTDNPSGSACSGSQVSNTGGFGGIGGHGGGAEQTIDEDTLMSIADTTGATYSRAESAEELTEVLADLPQHISTAHKEVDIASRFAGAGGLLAASGLGLSLWLSRVRRRTV